MSKTATKEDGVRLHRLVTAVLINSLEDGEVDASMLDKAIKFLKDNGITSFDMSALEDAVDNAGPPRPHLPDPSVYEEAV